MEQRSFGDTGLSVSVLGLGAAQVGDDDVDEKAAARLLHEVLDAGVTLLDTARGYGRSEELIGRHIAHRRDEFVLSSKCGYDVEGHENWTGPCVAAGIDRALRTLKTDRLDIMHLHSCPLEVLERGDVVDALTAAVDAGKVRVAAYSGENEALAWAVASGRFASVQASVNVCDQRILGGSLPAAKEAGLGFIAKRPLANAFWRHTERPKGAYSEEYWLRARAMKLQPGGLPWDEFALRFAAFQPGVCTCIAGTSKMDHFRRNMEIVAKGPLPAADVARVRKSFAEADDRWGGQV